MARFNASESANYGGQGGGGFFGISEDKGIKEVRFLYNNEQDIEGFSVHKVEVNGKERYVNCPRSYKDPIDACPFCRAQMKTQVKLFIPVYNIDEEQVQIWDRGKKMFEKMSSLCSRYATKDNLVQHTFEIERHGKPKDTGTTYEIYETGSDDTQLEDFDDIPVILGGLVMDKSVEDMEYYLEANEFPPEDSDDDKPVRRSSSKRNSRRQETEDDDEEEEEERPVRRSSGRPERRTPARRGDKY